MPKNFGKKGHARSMKKAPPPPQKKKNIKIKFRNSKKNTKKGFLSSLQV